MKKSILFIGTGGTIASEMTPEGLKPALTVGRLLSYVPEIEELCHTKSIQIMDLDSTNIGADEWLMMAKTIEDNYSDYDGFIISHGTDTMAYTAAALSYLIQNSKKPIILTGAQKPIGFDTTDSKQNLLDSFKVAVSNNMHGVCIVFNGRVILGTRAKKTHSKSFDAFSSINYPNIAEVRDGKLIQFIVPDFEDKPKFFHNISKNVGLLKLIPSTDLDLMNFMLNKYDALVIESFGVGGLPCREGMLEAVLAAAKLGKVIVITTQVQNEGSDLVVYNTGNALSKNERILEAYDMTTEAVVTKLMWIMSQTYDTFSLSDLFYTPVSRDILGS